MRFLIHILQCTSNKDSGFFGKYAIWQQSACPKMGIMAGINAMVIKTESGTEVRKLVPQTSVPLNDVPQTVCLAAAIV